MLLLQCTGCYRHLALQHLTDTPQDQGHAGVKTHITHLVFKLNDDQLRNPNSYLSPVMVKEAMWKLFRFNLNKFCRIWMHAAATDMLEQAATDEQLWAWLPGLSWANFLPLRHTCAFIGMQLLCALAAEAHEVCQATILGRQLLAFAPTRSISPAHVGRSGNVQREGDEGSGRGRGGTQERAHEGGKGSPVGKSSFLDDAVLCAQGLRTEIEAAGGARDLEEQTTCCLGQGKGCPDERQGEAVRQRSSR